MSKNVFEDLGFSPEEAAMLALKTDLHIEIMKITDESPGKVSDLTVDQLLKYLFRLGKQVEFVVT